MARRIEKLKAGELAKLPAPARGTKLYSDGAGLALQVSSGGARSWVFRYQHRGRERVMGLGPLDPAEPGKSLARARQLAARARELLAKGIDPIEEKRRQQAEQNTRTRKVPTFREAAELHIRQHEASWKNEVHRRQWKSTLETYAYPRIGDKPVDQIATEDVVAVLASIWNRLPETASRVRGRIERVLAAAAARGDRTGPNPATWRGHLDALLPAMSKVARTRPQPALPFVKMPVFMLRLRGIESTAARCLEFVILTATRSGEARGARWAEIDMAARVWTIPAERMKGGRQHRVPLWPSSRRSASSATARLRSPRRNLTASPCLTPR